MYVGELLLVHRTLLFCSGSRDCSRRYDARSQLVLYCRKIISVWGGLVKDARNQKAKYTCKPWRRSDSLVTFRIPLAVHVPLMRLGLYLGGYFQLNSYYEVEKVKVPILSHDLRIFEKLNSSLTAVDLGQPGRKSQWLLACLDCFLRLYFCSYHMGSLPTCTYGRYLSYLGGWVSAYLCR
jgi:hypothetical protein